MDYKVKTALSYFLSSKYTEEDKEIMAEEIEPHLSVGFVNGYRIGYDSRDEKTRDLQEQICHLKSYVVNLQLELDNHQKALKTLSDLIKEEYEDDRKMFGFLYRKSIKIKELLN